MTLPLQVLAGLSIVGGWIGIPIISGANMIGDFLAPSLGGHGEAHHQVLLELAMMFVSLAIAFFGIYIAYKVFLRAMDGGAAYAERWPGLYRLVLNKYYVDEIYDFLFVQPIRRFSVLLWKNFDDGFVDSSVNGAGSFVRFIGAAARQLQTGYVKSYAITMLVGALAIILYMTSGVK
jgi:NADH-quinone oxidoreductase subunit L